MDTNSTSNLAENYSGNPPVIERPIGAIAEVIHQRIEVERQKLAAEEANEKSLAVQRIALLTDGSDVDVDKCESAIDLSRSSQLRSLERIELLAEQLAAANRKAEAQRLDELTTATKAAQARGVKLIALYQKSATALASILMELRDTEALIATNNLELDRHGRAWIDQANVTARLQAGDIPHVPAPIHEVALLPNAERGQDSTLFEPVNYGHQYLAANAMTMMRGTKDSKLLIP